MSRKVSFALHAQLLPFLMSSLQPQTRGGWAAICAYLLFSTLQIFAYLRFSIVQIFAYMLLFIVLLFAYLLFSTMHMFAHFLPHCAVCMPLWCDETHTTHVCVLSALHTCPCPQLNSSLWNQHNSLLQTFLGVVLVFWIFITSVYHFCSICRIFFSGMS